MLSNYPQQKQANRNFDYPCLKSNKNYHKNNNKPSILKPSKIN
jgi:hypothetical protein